MSQVLTTSRHTGTEYNLSIPLLLIIVDLFRVVWEALNCLFQWLGEVCKPKRLLGPPTDWPNVQAMKFKKTQTTKKNPNQKPLPAKNLKPTSQTKSTTKRKILVCSEFLQQPSDLQVQCTDCPPAAPSPSDCNCTATQRFIALLLPVAVAVKDKKDGLVDLGQSQNSPEPWEGLRGRFWGNEVNQSGLERCVHLYRVSSGAGEWCEGFSPILVPKRAGVGPGRQWWDVGIQPIRSWMEESIWPVF